MYSFSHIAAFYAHKAAKDTTTFGKWNMLDKAGLYNLVSNKKRG